VPAGPLIAIEVKSTSWVPFNTEVTLLLASDRVVSVKVKNSENPPASGVLEKPALPVVRSSGPPPAQAFAEPMARSAAAATDLIFMGRSIQEAKDRVAEVSERSVTSM
jgi:hypothetical protein